MHVHAHAHAGCYFTGTRTETAEHKKVCSFKDETQLLAIAMKEVTLFSSYFQCSPHIGYACCFDMISEWEIKKL